MKARVKAAGEIVEVEPTFADGNKVYSWVTNDGDFHTYGSLDFENLTEELVDVKEKSFPKDEPDYYTKLHHQAAIAAMQGVLNSPDNETKNKYGWNPKVIAENAIEIATALVEKLKNEKL